MSKSKIERMKIKSHFYDEISMNYFENENVEKALLEKSDIKKSKNILIDVYKNLNANLLQVCRTSGSTGEVVEVLWETSDLINSNLTLWRLRKKYYNIDTQCKYITFHSIIYDNSRPIYPEKILNTTQNNLSFSKFHMEDSDLDYYYEKMREFQPEWFLIQPSVALRMIEYLENNKRILPQSLRYIELNGEMVTQNQKDIIANYFKVPVANMYGANEVNAIAYECPYGNMHIVTSNVLVQLMNSIEEKNVRTGDILISSLHNKAFPILGYNLGDKVSVKKCESCECGSKEDVIIDILGRNIDEFTELKGKRINNFMFMYCIEEINSRFGNPILQFKIIKSINKIKILLRLEEKFENWNKSIKNEIEEICNELMNINSENLSIEFVKEFINLSENGKFKFIEKELENEK